MEVWVRPNRRAILIGCLPPLLGAILCGLLAWWLGRSAWWWAVTLSLPAVGLLILATLILFQITIPRVSHEPGSLYLYVGQHAPVRLPTRIVECFFLGQGANELGTSEAETRNLVVRLAERETDWHHRELRRSIGHWCDGYITLNGIWCEPIDEALIRKLNHQLVNAKRAEDHELKQAKGISCPD